MKLMATGKPPSRLRGDRRRGTAQARLRARSSSPPPRPLFPCGVAHEEGEPCKTHGVVGKEEGGRLLSPAGGVGRGVIAAETGG